MQEGWCTNKVNIGCENADKLKRTALIHAVKSGHTHVASYLIALGANTDVADTSGKNKHLFIR